MMYYPALAAEFMTDHERHALKEIWSKCEEQGLIGRVGYNPKGPEWEVELQDESGETVTGANGADLYKLMQIVLGELKEDA